MFKLTISSGGSDDLSIAFDRDRARRQRELTENINKNEKYHVRMLKHVSGFAGNQEEATLGLG